MSAFSIRILDETVTAPEGPAFWGRIEAGGLSERFRGEPGPVTQIRLHQLWVRAVQHAVEGRKPSCLFTAIDLDTRGCGTVQAYGLIPSECARAGPETDDRGVYITEFMRTVVRDPADLATLLASPDDETVGPPYLLDLDRPEGFYRYIDTSLTASHWFLPDTAFEAFLNAELARMPAPVSDPIWFAVLNEVGIIAQLARAAFEARMPQGLALPQFSVLNHFVRLGDGRSPLDLARAFQVPKTSMTHTLAVLEEKGFVTIGPNPQDGRSKLVYITPAGRAFRDDAIAALEPDTARLVELAGPDMAGRLLPDLQKLRALMDAERNR